MTATPRRRLLLVFVAAVPPLTILTVWIYQTASSLLRLLLDGYSECIDDPLLALLGRTCASDSSTPVILTVELVLAAAIIVGAGALLTRWALQPVRMMARTVSAVGPTSLGMRLPRRGGTDEMTHLTDAINGMLDRVADSYEAQRRFAANASHELRTPLATQRTLIEVSLTPSVTPDQVELLTRQLLAANQRNETLIEGLLVLAETDRGLLSHAPQRLDEITSAVVENLRSTAERDGLDVRVAVAPTLVPGEAPLLERLVSNLISNAIKYNVPGGWVTVDVHTPGALTVSNSGRPVAPEHVSSLFEPFHRGGGERLEHGTGVGLGLSIIRSIVAAHHGTVTAQARPDGGLTVDVQLPG